MQKKRVLITGASGDIGTAAAISFANSGYELLLHYNRSEERIFRLRDTLTANGASVSVFRADLSSPEEIKQFADSCGRVDVLINNAGSAKSSLLTDLSDEEIISLIQTDLTSALLLTKKILPQMLRRKSGKIINISSMWGVTGASCEVAYSAAKAGLIGFTKALAKEVAPSGITVNCIAPGAVRTRMLDEYSPEALADLAEKTPLGRLGEPSEVASMMIYLASVKADFITGQTIQINGGFVI